MQFVPELQGQQTNKKTGTVANQPGTRKSMQNQHNFYNAEVQKKTYVTIKLSGQADF